MVLSKIAFILNRSLFFLWLRMNGQHLDKDPANSHSPRLRLATPRFCIFIHMAQRSQIAHYLAGFVKRNPQLIGYVIKIEELTML